MLVEGMSTFKYLGRPLDQTDDNWPAVRWNITRLGKVRERLGEFLRREGEDPRVTEMFYRAVTQAVLLFGLET